MGSGASCSGPAGSGRVRPRRGGGDEVRDGAGSVAGAAVVGGVTGGCAVGGALELGATGGVVVGVGVQPATVTLASANVNAKNCSRSMRMTTV